MTVIAAAHCLECRSATAGLCDACASERRAQEFARSELELDQRRAARELEWGRRGALVRVPHAWADDLATYEAAVTARHLRAVAERWSLERGSLLVLGPTGVGKTASVARALRRLVRSASSPSDPILGVRWTTASALAHARRRHPLGAGEAEEVALAIAAPVLVIDELGPEPLDAAIHDVLDARYARALVTITTAGMRRAELAARYGDATSRRMHAPHGSIVEVWA